MKLKQRITAIFVLVILICAVAITAVANDTQYSGTVEEASAMLDSALEYTDAADRMEALDELVEYLNTVNPEETGLADLNARIDRAELDAAALMLESIGAGAEYAEVCGILINIRSFLNEHPVPDELSGLAEFNSAYSLKCKATLESYLTAAAAKTTAADKHTLLNGVENLIAGTGYTPDENEIALIGNEGVATAKLYLGLIKIEEGIAKCGVAVRLFDNFTGEHRLNALHDDYAALMTESNAKKNDYLAAYTLAKAEVAKLAPYSAYNSLPSYSLTFEKSSETGILTAENNINGSDNLVGVESDGENSYYTVHYGATKHVRTNINLTSIKDYAVIEFDFTTFDKLPSREIWFEDGSRMYIRIQTNGDICDGKSKVLVKGGVVPGQWVHISFAVNVTMGTLDIYVDYQKVAEKISLKDTSGFFYTPSNLRIGANPSNVGGSFSLDNVRVYNSTAPMDIASVMTMTKDDKLIYFAERIGDTSLSASARCEYYEAIGMMLSDYYVDGAYVGSPSTSVKAAVQKYLNFNYETFLNTLSSENLSWLESELNTLRSYEKGEATYSVRKYYLERVRLLLASLNDYVVKGDKYDTIVAGIAAVADEIGREDVAAEFVSYVTEFFSALDISVKQEYCDLALGRVNILDLKYLLDEEKFPEFCDAYEKSKTLRDILAEYECMDNSKQLFACLTYLKDYPTVEDWEREFEFLTIFVNTANSIIKGGDYDPYYRSLNKMIEEYEPIRAYFYEQLQLTHIAYFTAEMAKFNASEQFFERYAISKGLDDYAKNNDIDYTNETLITMIAENTRNLEAMLLERDEHEQLVVENTAAFIEKCKGLVGSIDYKTMKAIYTEAAVYYYAMDVSDAAAMDAVIIFTARRDEIALIEENAAAFIMATALFANDDYSTLEIAVKCSVYLDKVNKEVPGVSEALSKFESELLEYDAGIASVNNEIVKTHDIAVTLATSAKTKGITALAAQAMAQ